MFFKHFKPDVFHFELIHLLEVIFLIFYGRFSDIFEMAKQKKKQERQLCILWCGSRLNCCLELIHFEYNSVHFFNF